VGFLIGFIVFFEMGLLKENWCFFGWVQSHQPRR